MRCEVVSEERKENFRMNNENFLMCAELKAFPHWNPMHIECTLGDFAYNAHWLEVD